VWTWGIWFYCCLVGSFAKSIPHSKPITSTSLQRCSHSYWKWCYGRGLCPTSYDGGWNSPGNWMVCFAAGGGKGCGCQFTCHLGGLPFPPMPMRFRMRTCCYQDFYCILTLQNSRPLAFPWSSLMEGVRMMKLDRLPWCLENTIVTLPECLRIYLIYTPHGSFGVSS